MGSTIALLLVSLASAIRLYVGEGRQRYFRLPYQQYISYKKLVNASVEHDLM